MELLLVEDESGIRDALSSFLRMQGIEVHTAANVDEALLVLAQNEIGCLVSDQQLPDGTGCELIDRFLEVRPSGHALLSTANQTQAIEAWLETRDNVQSLPKPLRPAQLLAWVSDKDRQAAAIDEDEGKSTRAREHPVEILEAASLGSEERDRCMLALLPFLDIARLCTVRREGSRIRLILDLAARHENRRTDDLISQDSRLILDRLGVDYWRVDRDSYCHLHVLVSMPWLETACQPSETLDLRGRESWGLSQLRSALERARQEGRQVVNLASWQRAGLELLGHASLIPDLLACKPRSESDRSMLWTDVAEKSQGTA